MPNTRSSLFQRLATAIDKAVALFAPVWGRRRAAARVQTDLLTKGLEKFSRHWDGAENDRHRGRSWLASRLSPDSALEQDLTSLRERSNELFRTNTWVSSYVRSLVRYVVGSGRRPKACIKATTGVRETQAKEWNQQAQDLFRRWARRAGVNGESLRMLQKKMARARALDGEAFAILRDVDDPDRVIPLAVELVSADRIETPREYEGDPRVRLGIRRNGNGQPLGVYVRRHHPHDTGTYSDLFDYEPMFDAKGRRRVLHHFEQLWEGQSRGVPDCATVLPDLKDMEDLWEAQIVRQQIQACFAVFIENTSDPTDIANRSAAEFDSSGRRLEDMSPGMVERLRPGEKPHFATPAGENNLDPFMKWRLRSLAAALDFPYELLVRHYENSYSGGRLALIDGHNRFTSDAALLDEQVNQPIYEQVMTEGLLTELDIPPRLFDESFAQFTACEWRGDPLPWIDPEKEVDAEAKAVALGVITLRDSVQRRGYDYEEFIAEREEQLRHFEDRKLPILVPAGWNTIARGQLENQLSKNEETAEDAVRREDDKAGEKESRKEQEAAA